MKPSRAKRGPAFGGDRMQHPTPKASATAERGDKKGHYRPIAKEFRHDGFTFRQIVREGDVAVYEQTWNGCANPTWLTRLSASGAVKLARLRAKS